MRVESEADRVFAPAAQGLCALAGVSVGALGFGWPGAIGGGLLGAGLGLGLARRWRARAWARRRMLATPFPESWRAFLREACDHYERLPPDWRRRFEDDLRLFLAEKRITGVGVDVTDELRLLVAASAVSLSVGWPDYEWDQLGEVLLYPDDFDRDFRFEDAEHADRAGETHPWGTVILSVPSLWESVEDPEDGFHVGLHEFAHLLDVDQTHFDGIPPGLSQSQAQAWTALAEREMEKLRQRKSVLDEYGEEDPAEFFAVAVEAFFEPALAVRRRHRELYDVLSAYFRQDPAAWDEARGLKP